MVDPATGDGECDTVVLVVGINDLEDVYIMKYFAGKYGLDDTIEQIISFDQEFNPYIIAVEGFGYQHVLGRQLENQMKKRGRRTGAIVSVGNVKRSKDARIRSLQPFINRGRVFVKTEHEELIEQIEEYPAGLKDIIDALSFVTFECVWSPPDNEYSQYKTTNDDPLILENIYARSAMSINTKRGKSLRPFIGNNRRNRLPARSDIFTGKRVDG